MALFALGDEAEALREVDEQLETLGGLDATREAGLVEVVATLRKRVASAIDDAPVDDATVASIFEDLGKLEAHVRGLGVDVADDAETLELPPEIDRSMLLDFLADQVAAVEELDATVRRIEDGDGEAVASLKRRLHTLKGESGLFGLNDLHAVCHGVEDYLGKRTPQWERVPRLVVAVDWVRDAIRSYGFMERPRVSANRILEMMADSTAPSVDPAGLGLPIAKRSDAEKARALATLGDARKMLRTVDARLLDGAMEQHAEATLIDGLENLADLLRRASLDELAAAADVAAERLPLHDPLPKSFLRALFDLSAQVHRYLGLARQSVERGLALPPCDGNDELLESLSARHSLSANDIDSLPPVRESGVPGRLGDILVSQGTISPLQLREALDAQTLSGKDLGKILVDDEVAPPQAIWRALRQQEKETHSGKKPPAPAASMDAPGPDPVRVRQAAAKLREMVKIDLERVDTLVDGIGELVIVEAMIGHALERRSVSAHLRQNLSQLQKITRDLQRSGLALRTTAVAPVFKKSARLARDLARRFRKDIDVVLEGEDTEMDRSLVEQIADPLIHLVRNGLDHGLEDPDERVAAGKPATGTLAFRARHEGNTIVIEIEDDGRGIDPAKVLAKARERGIVDHAPRSDAEAQALIFAPGFSTAAEVTEVSGRGVGMDVVRRNVEAMRGSIDVTSTVGRGSRFRLVLPLTLAIIEGLVVTVGPERFVLPTRNVREMLRPDASQLRCLPGDRRLLILRDAPVPLLHLGETFGCAGAQPSAVNGLVVVVEAHGRELGLVVDEALRHQQVVIKRLADDVDVESNFAGAAILSDGRVSLIIDVEHLPTHLGRRQQPVAPLAAE